MKCLAIGEALSVETIQPYLISNSNGGMNIASPLSIRSITSLRG